MSVYTELKVNLGDISINTSLIHGLKSTRQFLKSWWNIYSWWCKFA